MNRLLLYSCILLLQLPFLFSGSNKDPITIENYETKIANDSLLHEIREAYINDDIETFNQILFNHIQESELTYDEATILQSYFLYLENLFPGYDHPRLEITIDKTIELSEDIDDQELKFRAWISIAEAYIIKKQYDQAVKYASKALSNASANDNLEQKIRANLTLGSAFLGQENITESYQCYLNAKYLLTHLEGGAKIELQKKLRNCLYNLHKEIGNYQEATEHKIAQLRKCQQNRPVDSTELIWLKYDLANIGLLAGKEYPYHYNLDEILSYAERHDIKRLEKYTHALYRNYLIDNLDFESFYKLYHERSPEKLKKYKLEYPTRYLVFHTYFKEYLNQIDSAEIYYQRAEKLLDNNSDYYKANFYRRWGEFYHRYGKLDSTISKLEQSMKISTEIAFDYNILPVSKLLMETSEKVGDFNRAYKYQKIHNELNIENIEESHGELLLKMQLENQAKENEYLQEKKEAEINKKHSAQFFGIAIGLIILMITVAIISSLKVPAWFIEMLVFFSIVCLFEWIILYMDHEFHKLTHGEPIKMFMIKVVIISFLYPLHHVVENNLTKYLKKNNLLQTPTSISIRNSISTLWPWLKRKNGSNKNTH